MTSSSMAKAPKNDAKPATPKPEKTAGGTTATETDVKPAEDASNGETDGQDAAGKSVETPVPPDSGDGTSETDAQSSKTDGPDELVSSPKERPNPPATEDFVKVVKGNYVHIVTFYSDGAYGEVVLEDVSAVLQKEDVMSLVIKNTLHPIEFKVRPEEEDELRSKWRSLKAQRRNA